MSRPYALVLLLLSGCIFQNVSAEERLRDSVVGYNDETRWSRLDLAQARVVPGFQSTFRAGHQDWGRGIQIADQEIVNVEVGEDRDAAVSYVTVRWFRNGTMLLSETTLRQRWERGSGGYYLLEETVADGDPGLLEPPFREDEATEDEDGEAAEGEAAEGATAAHDDEGWDEPADRAARETAEADDAADELAVAD